MNKRPFRFGAREAWATASVRPTASSLSRSEATWNLAVWTEMPSRRAITLFDAQQRQNLQFAGRQRDIAVGRWRDVGGSDHRCIGGLSRTNQPQTRHARKQGGEPVGQRRVLDDEGQSDRAWCSILGQAAGLSAIVSETFPVDDDVALVDACRGSWS